jgi:hypothetical protein
MNGFGQGIPKYSENTCPDTLCPPQIPLDQTRERTRAAAVWSQRFASTMARPWEYIACAIVNCKTSDNCIVILILVVGILLGVLDYRYFCGRQRNTLYSLYWFFNGTICFNSFGSYSGTKICTCFVVGQYCEYHHRVPADDSKELKHVPLKNQYSE